MAYFSSCGHFGPVFIKNPDRQKLKCWPWFCPKIRKIDQFLTAPLSPHASRTALLLRALPHWVSDLPETQRDDTKAASGCNERWVRPWRQSETSRSDNRICLKILVRRVFRLIDDLHTACVFKRKKHRTTIPKSCKWKENITISAQCQITSSLLWRLTRRRPKKFRTV